MISAIQIFFPGQEAECVHPIRYLSIISASVCDHAWEKVRNSREDRYLRMQAAYLPSRTILPRRRLTALK